MKRFPESRQQYNLAKETALVNSKKNENLKNSIEESIRRIDEEEKEQKKKLIEILAKRKIQEEKGNYDYMRRNKKNYGDQA
jgi:hypothetical protein